MMLCCLTACGKSAEKAEPVTEATTQAPTEAGALQTIADAVIRQSGFEGVVMITQNGEVLAQSAVGSTNREPNAPVTPDTRFCVASVSKQFAATAIMLLQEQGLLSAGAVEHVRHDRRLFSRFCLRRLDHDTKSAFHAFRTLYR